MTHDLRRLRLEKRLTLAQLAAAAGVSKGFLSKIERGEGNPTAKTIEVLARVLCVTPGAIWPAQGFSDPSATPSLPLWPDDDVVHAGIQRAWAAVALCRRSYRSARERFEHMPARLFQALTKIHASEFTGAVTPADVQSELAISRKALYRELERMERELLIRRTPRRRGIILEIGPVGYLWLTEEYGLAEDLSPFDDEVFRRFWTKSCGWLASGPLLAGLISGGSDNQGDPWTESIRSRFDTMLRRGSETSTHARAATAAILAIVPRDPLNVAVDTRLKLVRFLTDLNTLTVSPERRSELEAELDDAASATKIAAGLGLSELSLSPAIFVMLRTWVCGALHQLELIESSMRSERERVTRKLAADAPTEQAKAPSEALRAGRRRHRPRRIG